MTWAFYAVGTPTPQGSKAASVFTPKGGGKPRALIRDANGAKLKPWRDTVNGAALDSGGEQIEGPVFVRMIFSVARPKSAPRRVVHPATLPDLDKLARAVGDAVTASGLWQDDSRVVEYVRLAKVFAGGADPECLPMPGVLVAACSAAVIDPQATLRRLSTECLDGAWRGSRGLTAVSTQAQGLAHIAEIRTAHSL